MALLNIPLWTTPPNWREPVTETLSWLSLVHVSPTGAEQRQAMRLTPRRSIEFSVMVGGAARAHFLGFLDRYGASEFYLPLWHEVGLLTRSESAGSVFATVDREMLELSEADAVCVAQDTPYGWPMAEVSAGDDTGGVTRLSLASPGWTSGPRAGQRVYPMSRARLDASSVSWTRQTDDLLTATVRVDLLGAQPWAGAATLAEHAHYPVVDLRPNEGRPQSGGAAWRVLDLDNQTGARSQLDTAGRAFMKTGHSLTGVHRGPTDAVRSLLYAMQGRVGQAWFVSPIADFQLREAVEGGDNQIVVTRAGYSDFGGPTADNDRIAVRLRDGTLYYRQITGASVIDNGDTELLTLDAGFDLGITPAEVLRISSLVPGRMDQDSFELVHATDTDGVCQVGMAVRRVPVLRSAADWTPPDFEDETPL